MSSKLKVSKEYFAFSRSEQRGILVLVVLIVLLIIAPFFYRSFITELPTDDPEIKAKVDSFFSALTLKQDESVLPQNKTIEDFEVPQSKKIEYFNFDPNTVKVEELVQLGLSLKQAQVIERYRSKGGIFRTSSDFAKVYVIDSSLFIKLKPWIKINPEIAASGNKVFRDSTKKAPEKSVVIELNSTDTLELLKVKGIGKVFARRIVAYRELLGGFVNVKQLQEVYGMKPDMFNEISKSFIVDSTLAKTINLNLITYEDIRKHPYISEYQAKAIIYYRSKVGAIGSINELVKNKIIPREKFALLKSYLVLR